MLLRWGQLLGGLITWPAGPESLELKRVWVSKSEEVRKDGVGEYPLGDYGRTVGI